MDLHSAKGTSFPQTFLILVPEVVFFVLSFKALFSDLVSSFRAADRDI